MPTIPTLLPQKAEIRESVNFFLWRAEVVSRNFQKAMKYATVILPFVTTTSINYLCNSRTWKLLTSGLVNDGELSVSEFSGYLKRKKGIVMMALRTYRNYLISLETWRITICFVSTFEWKTEFQCRMITARRLPTLCSLDCRGTLYPNFLWRVSKKVFF